MWIVTLPNLGFSNCAPAGVNINDWEPEWAKPTTENVGLPKHHKNWKPKLYNSLYGIVQKPCTDLKM